MKEEIKTQVLELKGILEPDVVKAVEKDSDTVLRYAVNQIARIRRLVDEKTLAGVMKGELAAEEKALEMLMLSPWEGPIVRFKEEHLQQRLEEGECKHLDFVKSNFRWVDENVCNLVEAGDLEGLRMASNQIHYKSMRGMEGQRNDFAGDIQDREKRVQQTGEEGWRLVERRKKSSKSQYTLFISGIPDPEKARIGEIWDYFNTVGGFSDIILPMKRGVRNRRYGFVKATSFQAAHRIMESLRYEVFHSRPLKIFFANEVGKKVQSKYENPDVREVKRINTSSQNKGKSEEVYQGRGKTIEGDAELHNETPSLPNRKDVNGDEGFKKQIEGDTPTRNPIPMIRNTNLEELSKRSVVCFSEYPLTGCILQDIIDELGIKEKFDFRDLKDWFIFPKDLKEEDFKIKRKALVEVRGLPCLAWMERNLKKITEEFGDWGWWENDLLSESVVSNPRIWIYTDNLRRISNIRWVKIGEVAHKILIYELEKEVIPSNRATQDKKSAESQIHIEKENEVEGDLIVNEVENSPLISSKTVVDETPSQHVKAPLEYKLSHSGDSRKRGNLILDLSKAEDKRPELVNLGDSSILEGSSQSTMCKFLRQIFINKPRRKRRRAPIRNPFDIGRCKLRKG
ncbi:hypothetical protein DCAR_0934729 [Daucus carota subsp. sativus]|uniref:RRM domain-containing protein n=1 Tax=Daucus carota subsp. sativus TaxID=79200 RepID=A0A175YGJ4_DAUCS|nr:hypothetical protein DCAR_0934729 [Daucus carota subsp. sativus]